MRKTTYSDLARKFLRGLDGLYGKTSSEAIREFAKWLTQQNKKQPLLPTTITVDKDCSVQISEHNGNLEIVVVHQEQVIRILRDKDGLHFEDFKQDV